MGRTDLGQAFDVPVATVGKALVAVPEDQWFDRKSARVSARDLADTAIGFANAEGGVIVVGLSDGRVEGIDGQPSKLSAWQQAALDFTNPPVPMRLRFVGCLNDQGRADRLLVIEVESSETVHANRRDEVFIRAGDENRRLTFIQRQELLYDKGQATYEATVVPGAGFDELDLDLLASYADSMEHPDPIRLLKARGLLSPSDQLTVGALLLFGIEPQARYPEAVVRVLRYRGSERGTGSRQQLLYDERCEGPIPALLRRAEQAVTDQMPSRRALSSKGRFEPIGLVPRDAWLEALVNAVVHRSYSLRGDHVRLEIFDDRLELESPGRFPGLVDPTDPLAITRFARNPRIARVCADLRFGQELGEGIRRMFEDMRHAGLAEPLFQQTSGSVRLTLLVALTDHRVRSLPAETRDLIRYLQMATNPSTGELVKATGRSRPVVLRRLRGLEEAGIVEWVGSERHDPWAYWRLRVE